MASPAASLGHPDSQQDADFFGSFGSPAQASAKSSPAQQPQHQQASMDPFDLFGEGSTVPAPGAAAGGSRLSPANDGLFRAVEGHKGAHTAFIALLPHLAPSMLHSLSSNLYTVHQGTSSFPDAAVTKLALRVSSCREAAVQLVSKQSVDD